MILTSFLLRRVAIGTSLLGHGLVRGPQLAAFSNGWSGFLPNPCSPGFWWFRLVTCSPSRN